MTGTDGIRHSPNRRTNHENGALPAAADPPEVGLALTSQILDCLPDAVTINSQARRVYVNDAFVRLLGLPDRETALREGLASSVHSEDRQMVRERASARERGLAAPEVYEFRIQTPAGELRVAEVHAMAVRYFGAPATMAVLRDVTERHRIASTLRRAVSIQQATLESTADGILVVDSDGNIVDFNGRFIELWGLTPSFVAGGTREELSPLLLAQMKNLGASIRKIEEIRSQPDGENHDLIELKDGRVFERHTLPRVMDGEIVGRVWSFRDITERRRLEERLRQQANHDPLTDLLNRRGFQLELARQLRRCARGRQTGALMLIDLDEFKDVNDSLGHQAGDRALVAIAELLRGQLSSDAVIGRLGGDEFTIFLPNTGRTQARRVARQIHESVNRTALEDDSGIADLTASIGVALFPQHGTSVNQLMARVDLAMYRAKEQGRNRVSVYVDGHQSAAEWRLRVRHLVSQALQRNRFMLYGQPIVDLQTNQVAHFELLLRMKAPGGRAWRASQFIEVAERSGLILAVDRWVVREAVSILAARQRAGAECTLEVNLSGRALSDPDLLRWISGHIASADVDPSRLVFEVTESAAISDLSNASRFVRSLKALGCRFALDDFGVGFSSLQHLKSLPVDYVKIDGSFIHGLEANVVDRELVKAVVAIAQALGMQTIAEFVNSAAQAELLRTLGVDFAQGYYVGRPRPISRLEAAWLRPEPKAA